MIIRFNHSRNKLSTPTRIILHSNINITIIIHLIIMPLMPNFINLVSAQL